MPAGGSTGAFAQSLGGGLVKNSWGSYDGVNGIRTVDSVTDYELDRQKQKLKHDAEQNRLSREAQLGPIQWRQSMFEKLYPQFGGQFGAQGSRVGGEIAQQPPFSPSPVYTDGQINQQVNAAVGANDRRYATQDRQLNTSNAVRGFGSNSPLAAALRQSLGMANAQENAVAEREIPFQAAQANADSLFRGQGLQQQMWNQREDSDIRRRQQNLQGFTSLLNLLGG